MNKPMSMLSGLAVIPEATTVEPSSSVPKSSIGKRIKRFLIATGIMLFILGALGGAAYWRLYQITRERLISELMMTAANMESQTEFMAARDLYLRAAKVNVRSPQNAIAQEKAGRIQPEADRQAAQRAVIDRQIAEIRGTLADLEMRKQRLEEEKDRLDREVQTLSGAKTQVGDQLVRLQEDVRQKTSQFAELTASVSGLSTRNDQLTAMVSELDDARAKLQASVDRIKWIAGFPEAMLKYHETVFKPAVRQLGDASLRLSVVVRAVDLGLKNDDYIGALIAKEMEVGGCVREAQAVIERGRILVAQGDLSPEVGKLIRSQQANLERIVDTLVGQCSRFSKKEIQRGALNSWLGSMPDDLNNIVKIERKLYESAAPVGWPADDTPLVKEVRGAINSADIVKYLDMLDRNEAWESNVEVAYLAANPPASIRALVPGTVVISVQDSPVRNAEEAASKMGEAGDDAPVTVKYIEAGALAKGVMTPKTLVATKKELAAISWRTSYKKIK